MVVGAGTYSDGTTSKTFALGDSGGEYNHKLTTAEMPSHNHILRRTGGAKFNNGTDTTTIFVYDAGNPILDTTNTGGDQSHNNIQPYAVAKRWTRTA